MMESTGFVRDLDSETMDRISTIQEGFAKLGQRVLLLAKKIIPSANLDQALLSDATDIEERLTAMNTDLTVVGLISLYDPPREDTEETVRVCRGAGIRFAMVTGAFGGLLLPSFY
jgi:sodium/potassium-transporting ATPase subunit alpha